MNETRFPICTAFAGMKAVATGSILEVAKQTKIEFDNGDASILIFNDYTSEPIEIDFRGTLESVIEKLEAQYASTPTKTEILSKGPGRPKLGVVSREVTLLPRHWEWLQSQPGGASVALRKLIDEARKSSSNTDLRRTKTEVTYKFMSAMTGNLKNFEDVSRALFAHDETTFIELIRDWPSDIQQHLKKISVGAFADTSTL